MKKIHILSVESESCDTYGPFLFSKKLDDNQLEAFLREHCSSEWPDDDDEGPGIFGSYLYVSWSQSEVY